MQNFGQDSLKTQRFLKIDGNTYYYFNLNEAGSHIGDISKLPYTLKVLLENLLRFEDGRTVTVDDIREIGSWLKKRSSELEIAYHPTRVLMQDFTGVPAIVDLATMREAMKKAGKDPKKINPLAPVDLIIDHSVMVDEYATTSAFKVNVQKEYDRNRERYAFLHWGQQSFDNFRVVPPGTGICHQVNLEYLAQVIWTSEKDGKLYAYPDTLVGTDSHTTMVNGLSVLGWGVGGIEAEAAMLGQPISMLFPEVIGFKMTGALKEGTTATDLVLTVTQMLRTHGVVGKFVEFYGEGLDHLSIADRATISNMSPEYGATCGFFPIDQETLKYLEFTGREPWRVKLVEAYAKEQGLWRNSSIEPVYTDTLTLDLSTIEATLAGPKKPQSKILLSKAVDSCEEALKAENSSGKDASVTVKGESFTLKDGDVVIAAITSCTNTSNPSVMLGAALIAKKAVEKGLKVKPWVKTSLAPGSQVVSDYFEKADLQKYLDTLGFTLVGYGCTTCIGNSGPLLPEIAQAVDANDLSVCSVLSGNRNFEGRIHPQVKLNYLASPMLVVAYALAGSLKIDLTKEPLGIDREGKPVYLKDIWPTNREIEQVVGSSITPQMFKKRYGDVFKGDDEWNALGAKSGLTYEWDDKSTYVRLPPFFETLSETPLPLEDIQGARPLALLGDSITTDHISPAGSIKTESPAGSYLIKHAVDTAEFNSYGSRRGNHEVMMRGTFANIRLKNEMVPGVAGGMTRHMPDGTIMTIYDAAMLYIKQSVPLVVIAGKEYGTGSSRDWAAKGAKLLGVKAVIAESFERIHRSNLIGMGVLPLEFLAGDNRLSLGLDGTELFDITGIKDGIKPRMLVECKIKRLNGEVKPIQLKCRIDTLDEKEYYTQGGILHYVLRNLIKAA
jgi:aconitate hydratase